MATYAVGDIQGRYDDLRALFNQIRFGDTDTLWCVGDLINRGGQDLETLRFLHKLGERAVIVLGNHDLHLLACAYGARKLNKKDTFGDILDAPDSKVLLEWLRQKPLLHHCEKLAYTMTHAGIPPLWNLDLAKTLAREVEQVLHSGNPQMLFDHMYGNEPDVWDETLSGTDRLRTITNYFTRMRFCGPNGELEFVTKSGPEAPPEGFLPWYSYPQHKCANERLLFGHWAALEGNTGITNFVGLDTGCVWGGQLTALRLEDGEKFCVDCAL